MKKACCLGMLPADMELEARLALAKRVGFDGVEPGTLKKKSQVRALEQAAADTGIEIASIMNSDHWGFPLSSAKRPTIRARRIPRARSVPISRMRSITAMFTVLTTLMTEITSTMTKRKKKMMSNILRTLR